ncbi:ribonuclease III [Erythrobacter sp. HKB08]|uniref:ribonuclease III n=1 Tax=Erythrobacter sp. HKB08 TaxID=2502843 RepID=UPI001F3C8D8B|nr:ribonuclease III [Erythrobacter sp. HKB08]
MSELATKAREWLEAQGFAVRDEALWHEALTHGSTDEAIDYQRLEFLGDRVLGLAVAEWLYRNSNGAEGKLALRLNALVSKGSCAKVARSMGASEHIRLGKQARDDGAANSENVLGDIMEALLGASFLESGFDATREVILRLWADALDAASGEKKHPKSALQEWAAGNQRRPPKYELVERSGPDHKARFTVRVSVHKVGETEATANSKQEAETEAARKFMEQYG